MAFPILAVLAGITALTRLMGIAEALFSKEPKSGAQKKELVTSAFNTVIDTVASVSTGGQKETWAAVREFYTPEVLSQTVDNIAPVFSLNDDDSFINRVTKGGE
jgi:hypothetical protein